MLRTVSSRKPPKTTPSFIGKILTYAQQTGSIDLATGYTDIPPPGAVREYFSKKDVETWYRYSPPEGFPQLRERLAEKLHDENGIDVDPDSEVTVTIGSSGSLASSMFAVVKPGEEVLVFEPYYSSYLNLISLTGGKPVLVPLSRDKMLAEEEALRSKITPNTRAIIVNTPNNPTSRVFSLQELKMIANLCVERNLIAIADEVYEKLVYNEHKHFSIGSLPGMSERTITCNSFSKTFGMAGYRIGYVAANKEISKRIRDIHQNLALSPPSYCQLAALVALEHSKEYLKRTSRAYAKRRNYVLNELRGIDGTRFVAPEGTFFVYINVDELEMSGLDFTRKMLVEAGVAVTPGNEFGDSASSYVRLCFARKSPTLVEGMTRIYQALSSGESA